MTIVPISYGTVPPFLVRQITWNDSTVRCETYRYCTVCIYWKMRRPYRYLLCLTIGKVPYLQFSYGTYGINIEFQGETKCYSRVSINRTDYTIYSLNLCVHECGLIFGVHYRPVTALDTPSVLVEKSKFYVKVNSKACPQNICVKIYYNKYDFGRTRDMKSYQLGKKGARRQCFRCSAEWWWRGGACPSSASTGHLQYKHQ
jgi:hypothetical protein